MPTVNKLLGISVFAILVGLLLAVGTTSCNEADGDADTDADADVLVDATDDGATEDGDIVDEAETEDGDMEESIDAAGDSNPADGGDHDGEV